MDILTISRPFDVIRTSATLFVEDRESADEQRCFGELIDFLVERGAETKRCE
jgi:hypothetical protein